MAKRKRKASSTSSAPPKKKIKKNSKNDEKNDDNFILSTEARKQLGYSSGEEDSNNIILSSDKKTKKKKQNKKKETPSKPPMSKTQLKKMKKLEEKKVKQSKRSGLFESLKQSQLSDEQLRLLRSTRNLGTKETMKQKLRRALSYQRAGLEVDKSVPLVKERVLPDAEELDQMIEEKYESNVNNNNNENNNDISNNDSIINKNIDENEDSISSQNVNSKLSSLEKLIASGKYSQQELLSKINDMKYGINKSSIKKNEEEDMELSSASSENNEDEGNNDNDNNDSQESKDKYQNFKTTEDLVTESKIKNNNNNDNENEENILAPKRPRLFNFSRSQADQYRSFNEILKTLESERMQKMKEMGIKKQKIKETKFYVSVDRDPEIQRKRLELPVCAEEQIIMEKINENDVVIVCGETGSGKTTQVPQFLYEAGYAHPEGPNPGLIGVTQPRRVAAVSTARRVSVELNKPFGTDVAYQIRYEKNVSAKTKIKFMTDGILLKEVQTDFLLRKYSSILIDEAHERNVNTDILVGLLSRIVPLRRRLWQEQQLRKDEVPPEERIYPLKVIIMSATLRVDDFTKNKRLFGNDPPPVVNVDARQYPVTVHFSKKTSLTDYVQDAFTKIGKIHTRLPPGGILVFLTGKQEIEYLVNKLDQVFGPDSDISKRLKEQQEQQKQENQKEKETSENNNFKEMKESGNNQESSSNTEENEEDSVGYLMSDNEGASDENDEDETETSFNVSIADMKEHEDEDDDVEVEVQSEDESDDDEWEKFNPSSQDVGTSQPTALHVLPLYSMLSPNKQMRVFESPPEGHRLCIVATNVAETSLTIPGIRYVVDTGRQKAKVYDRTTGITSYQIRWTSKASADQRAGRAGRTGPGHCYRLYSSAVYDQRFEQFTDPELLNVPIDSTILQMKSMGIDNISSFPFPTPPLHSDVEQALYTLSALGAVSGDNSTITRLGQTLSMFPLHPRFAKMILLGKHRECMPYIIAVVSALSAPEIFQLQPPQFTDDDDDDNNNDNDDDDNNEENVVQKLKRKENKRKQELQRYKEARSRWENKQSDLLAMLNAVGAYEFSTKKEKFCYDNFLNIKSMKEVHALRLQLCHMTSKIFNINYSSLVDLTHLRPPSSSQQIILRQIIAAGYVDRVAHRVPSNELEQININTRIHKGRWPYVSMATGSTDSVFIHPTSYLSSEEHEYIVYNDMVETAQVYMKGVTAIHPAWLPELGKPLVTYPKPLDQPPPKYSKKKDRVLCFVRPTYGPQSWSLPLTDLELSSLGDKYKPVAVRVFARAFMEGKVFPVMKGFVSAYTTSPAHITRAMVGSTPKVDNLVSRMQKLDVLSKQCLADQWKKDKSFLLKEFLMWMPESAHSKIKGWWPPSNSAS